MFDNVCVRFSFFWVFGGRVLPVFCRFLKAFNRFLGFL